MSRHKVVSVYSPEAVHATLCSRTARDSTRWDTRNVRIGIYRFGGCALCAESGSNGVEIHVRSIFEGPRERTRSRVDLVIDLNETETRGLIHYLEEALGRARADAIGEENRK